MSSYGMIAAYLKRRDSKLKEIAMKSKSELSEHMEIVDGNRRQKGHSPLELWGRMHRGERKSQRVERAPFDSMMAVFADRVTYTFILENEVASIHFDRRRGEIFFKGHNISNMELTPPQREALMHMGQMLTRETRTKPFSADYDATLGRLLADNE